MKTSLGLFSGDLD